MNKKIDYQKHINRMSKIAPLSDKEMKILAELHILRDYKKNTIIDIHQSKVDYVLGAIAKNSDLGRIVDVEIL